MWNEVEKGFQIAFESAWKAYISKTIPIGACILNEKEEVISVGQNEIYTKGSGPISRHKLAHAETNAILNLNDSLDPKSNIRNYTLYTVMEPCPLCFGAIVMGNIKRFKYAARDGYAGAVTLNSALEYIKSKEIKIEGPFYELEMVQIAIQSCYELSTFANTEHILKKMAKDCQKGVELGRKLNKDKTLEQYVLKGAPFNEVYNYLLSCNV